MKRSLIINFVGLVFVAVLSLNANAQMSGCMGESGRGMMHGMGGMHKDYMMMDDDHPMWKHLKDLGLDEKQKDALNELRTKTMKDMVRKMADTKIADIELKSLLDKDPVDMKAVEAAAKKSASFRTDMFLAHIKAYEEMKTILTPEQKKRLKDMMEMGNRPGAGGCGMMGGDAEHKNMPMPEHMH